MTRPAARRSGRPIMGQSEDSAGLLQRLFGIEGKSIVVTDNGGGWSPPLAAAFASAGARLVIGDCDIDRWNSDNAAAASACTRGVKILDLEDEASIVTFFAACLADLGSIDVLVNCAGLAASRRLPDVDSQLWDRIQSINLRSIYICMREAIKIMVRHGGGRIINITSMGALHPVLHGNAAYASARAGVTMLTKACALDHAVDGILVNAILPGAVQGAVPFAGAPSTQSVAAPPPLTGPVRETGRLPLGYGTADPIVAAALFLAGPAGAYCTGETVVMDGGFLIS